MSDDTSILLTGVASDGCIIITNALQQADRREDKQKERGRDGETKWAVVINK